MAEITQKSAMMKLGHWEGLKWHYQFKHSLNKLIWLIFGLFSHCRLPLAGTGPGTRPGILPRRFLTGPCLLPGPVKAQPLLKAIKKAVCTRFPGCGFACNCGFVIVSKNFHDNKITTFEFTHHSEDTEEIRGISKVTRTMYEPVGYSDKKLLTVTLLSPF